MSDRVPSLEHIGVSAGTAAVLGLIRARLQETPTTAHFLFGEKCLNNCAFCSQASGATGDTRHLSRVTWPQFPWDQVKEPLKDAVGRGAFKRVCVQTTECPDTPEMALLFIRRVGALSGKVFISASVAPVSVARIRTYFDAGATNIGLPLDAATSAVYERVKGGAPGTFEKAWTVLEKAAEMWPGRISTHLIVGLGETEEEAARFLARAKAAGVTVGLFAFTPVRGTAMAACPPPGVASYRRVQVASHFLKRGGGIDGIEFLDGRIIRVRLEGEARSEAEKGVPFETSGCLHCNRPYYNERPGQVMMNYPRPLSGDEAREALADSELFKEAKS